MIPLIINRPEKMRKVRLISIKDYTERTLAELKKAGILHIETASELDPMDRAALNRDRSLIRQTLLAIGDVVSLVEGERHIEIPHKQPAAVKLSDINSRVKGIRGRTVDFRDQIEALQTEILNGELLLKHLSLIETVVNVPVRDLQHRGAYIFTDVYVLSTETYHLFDKRLGSKLLHKVAATAEDRVVLYAIALREDRKDIDEGARGLGAMTLSIPDDDRSIADFLKGKRGEIDGLEKKAGELKKALSRTINETLEEVVVLREMLLEENARMAVIELAAEARYVTLIEGWMPESADRDAFPALKASLDHAFIDVRPPSQADEPPTLLVNPAIIRPFQVIVNLFSLPRYGDWDPTPAVACFFAFFFGLMLNDVVYAAGLIVTARFLLPKIVDDAESEEFLLFRKVLYISGASSLVLGLLSGSYLGDFFTRYFGIPSETMSLARSIQTNLLDSVTFIVISLVIGIIHVNIAHILALIRAIKERNGGVIVGKMGLFLVELFGIPYLTHTILRIDLISLSDASYGLFMYPLSAGLVLIVIAGFMQMGSLGGIFWIFELTGILGDIMSYSRLAGVGLATYYLASSFNLIAEWIVAILSGIMPGIVGKGIALLVMATVIVIMHIFNMLMSSLAAFIHSLRLCFVEFLLKFYEGGGRPYAPYRIRARRHVAVGLKP